MNTTDTNASPHKGMVTVRDAVIGLFRELGINTIFGNPGSTELPMFRDFPSDFRYVLGLQESVAVAMADGFAQATRTVGVVNLHSASGVGHGLGNIYTAFKNRTPLIVIAGQQSRSILPFDPYLFAQDAAQFPRPYVKFSVEPARAEDVPAAIARAYYMATQPPFGPTFVSVPVDDWDRLTEPVVARPVTSGMRPDPTALRSLADALSAAERPAFVMGAEVDRDGAWELGVQLAEQHNALVYAAPQSSRSSFPEDHPLFAGFLPAMRERIVAMLSAHDLVVVLGAQVFPYHVEGQGPFIGEGTKLFQLTEDGVAASSAPIGHSIICTMRLALEDLTSLSPGTSRPKPEGRKQPTPVEATAAITEASLMQALSRVRPANSVLVNESPSTSPFRQTHLPILQPDSFYVTGSGGLGYGMPASVGVALGQPSRKVIALIGDGSAMYSIQALYTAAQLGLPVTFVIANNRRYEALQGFASHFDLPRNIVGTELSNLDFVALAKGHGCDAVRVSDGRELDAALNRAMSATTPFLLQVDLS